MGAMKKATMEDGGERYWFWCKPCDTHHTYQTKAGTDGGPVWQFDGNEESPTFSPSLLVRHGRYLRDAEGEFIPTADGGLEMEKVRCHLYVRKGMVQYLGDCSHSLAGQTVPVEPPCF